MTSTQVRQWLAESNHSAAVFLAATAMGVGLYAAKSYEGSLAFFWIFNVSAAVTAVVLLLRPHSSFMTAFVAFLGLGFWLKFIFSAITGASYIEPTGSFEGNSSEWDETLSVASVAFLATAIAMALPRPSFDDQRTPYLSGSNLYRKIEKPLAVVSIIAAVGIFALNWPFKTMRTGLDPEYVIPFGGHIVASYIILWGAGLWLGCMGYWAFRSGRLSMLSFYIIATLEAFISTVSNVSRARFLFHMIGFGLGWWKTCRTSPLRPGKVILVGLIFLVAFAGSIVVVSWERIGLYAGNEQALTAQESTGRATRSHGFAPVEDAQVSQMARQVSQLFIARWVGMEGVMSVVSSGEAGPDLFIDGMTERPDAAHDGIYERLSNSHYHPMEGRTFLTTAGGVAVLYYSGSLLIVFFGVLSVAYSGVWFEWASLRLTQSPFAAGLASVVASNSFFQVNQPYLSAVVVLNTLFACFAVWAFIASIRWAEGLRV